MKTEVCGYKMSGDVYKDIALLVYLHEIGEINQSELASGVAEYAKSDERVVSHIVEFQDSCEESGAD